MAPRRRKCGNAATLTSVSVLVTYSGGLRPSLPRLSTGVGNPKASVARIKVAGRFPACETVSLLFEGRTVTHEVSRAKDKKSFTAVDLEQEVDKEVVEEKEQRQRKRKKRRRTHRR